MSQTLITTAKITKEALRLVYNNCVAAKATDRRWEKEFAVEGNKIGQTINIRKANRAALRQGRQVRVDAIVDEYIPMTLSDPIGSDFAFNSSELALSVEEFAKRYLTSRCATIANKIDYDVCASLIGAYNMVGTPGTTPGTAGGTATGIARYNSPIVYLNAGMMLDNTATPRDGQRKCIINPLANAESVSGLSGLYNPTTVIGEQFEKGRLGYALDLEFAMDQNVNTYTTGTRAVSGEVTVNSTNAGAGESTISITGGTATIAVGDVFTITSSGYVGVHSVNPIAQTFTGQVSTGQLQQFTVTAAATEASPVTISVSPAIRVAAAGVGNATVDRVPTATDLLTFVGAASTVTAINAAFHPEAIALAVVDLPLPGGQVMAARETYDGFSIRVIQYYDGGNDLWVTRLDVQYGILLVRPEFACRIAG